MSKCGPSWHYCAFTAPIEATYKILEELCKNEISENGISFLNLGIVQLLKSSSEKQKKSKFSNSNSINPHSHTLN